MTLFKQVALIVSLVFLLIVVTTTIGDFRRSGEFLEGQLQTAAQDMTTTLGIAISNSSISADKATYETLFNAVFDSGYYSSIELVSPDGELIHRKDRIIEIEGVPAWFIEFVPLWPATGETQVMQGWLPLGTLKLTLHPGYVYISLYENLKSTLSWLAILFSCGMIILWLLLHKILKPLVAVKEQAEAIHKNQFKQQEILPRTIELRSVVVAMNRMVEKVHIIFESQEKTLASYQKLLYEDDQSGLPNRKYFMSQLERAQMEESSVYANISVIKIHNLEYVHDHNGYEKSDLIVDTLSNILKSKTKSHEAELCARINDDEFALLLPVREKSAVEYINEILEEFKQRNVLDDVASDVYLTAGITSVHKDRSIGETLAESDFALTQAASSGAYAVFEKKTTEIGLPQGKIQWRSWLEDSIKNGRFYLVAQKVVDTDNNPVHQEVFIRIKNEQGQVVPAGMFMPMANSLELGEAIDSVVFGLVKQYGHTPEAAPLALNLTDSVFSHADALLEFNHLLEYFDQTTASVCIEASHAILERYPAMCKGVAETVRESGNVFGIDNLNLGLSLQALQTLRPDYVKINAKTLYDMTRSDMPAAFQTLMSLTRALDIRLIAVAVDSQKMYDHLLELGVKTMQGNLISEAEELL